MVCQVWIIYISCFKFNYLSPCLSLSLPLPRILIQYIQNQKNQNLGILPNYLPCFANISQPIQLILGNMLFLYMQSQDQ